SPSSTACIMAAIAIASIIIRAPSSEGAQIFRNATDQSFRNHQDLDELVAEMLAEVRAATPAIRDLARQQPLFEGHKTILECAIERFEAEDYVSATGLLYPRIEGVLRTWKRTVDPGNYSAAALARAAATDQREERHPFSLLHPYRFEEYLRRVFFKSFDADAPEGVGRHSVSHGVAPENDFGPKSAMIALLTLDQLAFMLRTS
ncbi:MAG: hypothetical protein VYE22_28505, partial [Myxococcota bacterium]|nr:hypothetical protein [Myxococcota bacterium]